MEEHDIPIYEPHEGTLKISGQTPARKAAKCAFHNYTEGKTPLEFFFIGANAGQQAMKATGIFRHILERETCHVFTVLYQPRRVRVKLKDSRLIEGALWVAYVVERFKNTEPVKNIKTSSDLEFNL